MALIHAETLRADLAEAAGSLGDRSFSVLSASSPATASATTSKTIGLASTWAMDKNSVGRESLAERRTMHPRDQDKRKFPNSGRELVPPRGGRTPGSARAGAGIAPGGLSFPGQGSLSSQTSP
ncbi:hypothetical protein EJB05_34606, partial [Eragrostis curvula]